jgi:hypothetical protein
MHATLQSVLQVPSPMPARKRKPDLTTALFRVTQGKTGLAVHRDAEGKIIEQREIPYITSQQYTGEDLLASIVSAALAGTIMFLGYQLGRDLADRAMHPERYRKPPSTKAGRARRAKELREQLESRKRSAALNADKGRVYPKSMAGSFDATRPPEDFGLSVQREWLQRRLPAELAASEMQEIEIIKIPGRYS